MLSKQKMSWLCLIRSLICVTAPCITVTLRQGFMLCERSISLCIHKAFWALGHSFPCRILPGFSFGLKSAESSWEVTGGRTGAWKERSFLPGYTSRQWGRPKHWRKFMFCAGPLWFEFALLRFPQHTGAISQLLCFHEHCFVPSSHKTRLKAGPIHPLVLLRTSHCHLHCGENCSDMDVCSSTNSSSTPSFPFCGRMENQLLYFFLLCDSWRLCSSGDHHSFSHLQYYRQQKCCYSTVRRLWCKSPVLTHKPGSGWRRDLF